MRHDQVEDRVFEQGISSSADALAKCLAIAFESLERLRDEVKPISIGEHDNVVAMDEALKSIASWQKKAAFEIPISNSASAKLKL